MVYAFCLLGLATAAFALYRSAQRSGFYDGDIYGMTARTHLRYASAALISSGLLVTSQYVPIPSLPFVLEAVVAILVVFYFTSFLRGAHEDL